MPISRTALCALCLWLAPLTHVQSVDTTPRALLANVAKLDIDPAAYLIIGTVIAFTYRGLTKNGLPRFASYLRVREVF
jgi:hypothetical protein